MESRTLKSVIIEWDGEHLPNDLRRLPPGWYLVQQVDDPNDLTSEEEEGLLEAIAELEAGKGIPAEEVFRSLRDLSNKSADG